MSILRSWRVKLSRRPRHLRGDGDIEIVRDEHGVAHVRSSTEADAYRALGYCHGSDRGLQMILTRILGQGRASEHLVASDETLRLDRFFRRANLIGDLSDEVDKLAPRHRHLAEAYCDGVNRALRRHLPVELRLMRHRPSPWEVADALLLARVVGYVLMTESQGALERFLVEMVQGGVPRSHLEELFPGMLGELDEDVLAKVTLGDRLVPPELGWGSALPSAAASNNWALAPGKTASGSSLFANDPHLEINRLPALWYEIVLEWGSRFCVAATMPGIPGALIGRSNDVAWGPTYACMDQLDSWVEECRGGCYKRIEHGAERWLPFNLRTEVIKRKRMADVEVEFFENDHGALDGNPFRPGLYLSSRWSGSPGSGARSLAAVLDMPSIGDTEAGMAELGRIETPWNWVLADRNGRIGYQMSGLLPRRGGDARGLVALPGWEPDNDWRGVFAVEDLPRLLDPEEGFVVTANDDLNHLGTSDPIAVSMGSDRAERIAELLSARHDWSPEDCEAMQMDVVSRQAQRFMAILRPLLAEGPHTTVLREWECDYKPGSPGAHIFEAFYRALVAEVFGRVCGKEVLSYLLRATGMLAGFYATFDRVLLAEESVWFGGESRDAIFTKVAARVLEGPPAASPSANHMIMGHLVLGGRVPSWLGFDYGPIALRGGRATIHQGQSYTSGGRRISVGPSYRFVTDLSEETARTTLPGGASGRRLSPWYTYGIEDWLAGRSKRLGPSRG